MNEMSSHMWTIFLSTLVLGATDGNSETTAYPEIPSHLLQCYMNDGVYHKANRIPNSYESFVDLIRKVEESPTGRNINARELSLVLLHYLKLDGIQSVQSRARMSSNIIPFAPSGDEYFKHRLTLIGLLPKIDQSYMAAVNESLSQRELCNLHFMLSYSIDPYKRDNERCSPIYDDYKTQSFGESNTDWYPYQSVPGYYQNSRRIRRDFGRERLRHSGKISHKGKESKKTGRNHSGKTLTLALDDEKREKSGKERMKRMADDKRADVEIISIHPTENQKRPKVTEKDRFTIGSQELLSEDENNSKGMQSLIQSRPVRYGGRSIYPRTGYGPDDGSTFSNLFPNMPLSDCPSVNGIITTPFGSLAIGTVIGGIAAGLNPEDIPPTKLSVNPTELENQMDRVNNVWATTLAGTVADTLSSPALLEMDNLQILKGGWNDSANPRWYLLKNNQFNHLTEVSLRGSLDGLFLGLSAKELTNKFSNIKLSQLLEIYYQNSWAELGAKNRVAMRPQYAPDDTFKKQVHLMSLVLKRQKTKVITVLNFDLIVRDVVSRISSSIQNLDDRNVDKSPAEKIDAVINMVAVVDSSWGHESLRQIFEAFRKAKVAAAPQQSNLTIVCGNDGRTLMHANNILDLDRGLTREMLFENCTRGMNFYEIFDSLEFFYRKLYKLEETLNKVNDDAQVLVLLPYETFIQDNIETIALKSREFQHTFPDVRLVIAANGRSDAFEHLVKNRKNIFTIVSPSVDPDSRSIRDFAIEIKQSHQRISRPSCGSYFDDTNEGGEIRMTREIYPDHIVYYQLLPNYFFTSRGEVTVTVRSKQRVPLTVCHSREVEKPEDYNRKRSGVPNYPNADRTPNHRPEYSPVSQMDDGDGPVHCKTITSEAYKIELNDPCYGAYTLDECRPLYISLQAQQQPLGMACPTCRLPLNVQSEISVVGLTCYNSAIFLLSNPLTLFLPILFSLLNTRIL